MPSLGRSPVTPSRKIIRPTSQQLRDAAHILAKDRPHYYLWGLAVDPAQKSKGIATALMQPVLEKADAQKMPIYLETHDENNVGYYRKHDFDLIHTVSIPKYDLPIWCMLREPRGNQ